MENASKALIMAGEILIAVLILSLAAYSISLFGSFSKNMNEQISETKIRAYNVKFTSFSGRANISIQEIASIINFAIQNNNSYDAKPGDSYYVDVFIDDESVLGKDINNLLDNNKNNKFYTCNVTLDKIKIETNAEGKTIITAKRDFYESDITYNTGTKLVNKIVFHEIENQEYANAILQGATINFE